MIYRTILSLRKLESARNNRTRKLPTKTDTKRRTATTRLVLRLAVASGTFRFRLIRRICIVYNSSSTNNCKWASENRASGQELPNGKVGLRVLRAPTKSGPEVRQCRAHQHVVPTAAPNPKRLSSPINRFKKSTCLRLDQSKWTPTNPSRRSAASVRRAHPARWCSGSGSTPSPFFFSFRLLPKFLSFTSCRSIFLIIKPVSFFVGVSQDRPSGKRNAFPSHP